MRSVCLRVNDRATVRAFLRGPAKVLRVSSPIRTGPRRAPARAGPDPSGAAGQGTSWPDWVGRRGDLAPLLLHVRASARPTASRGARRRTRPEGRAWVSGIERGNRPSGRGLASAI